ncbi:MAG TPA: hypothetical protein VMH28_07600 [Candidatus Acidoferrales bacterium]|nr:hypothetical protein [Candidatus Acidoferrales bacterium]
MVTIERQNYKGWPNSWRMTNGEVDLVVTGDIGPRVMRFGFVGGQNFFKEFEDQLGLTGEDTWQLRGGHRVWIAPEDPVMTYAPDNSPCGIAVRSGRLEATGPVEALTGLEKKLIVTMAPAGTEVEVAHQIRNGGSKPYRLAPWALTMMAQGGWGIHGFPPRGTHPEVLPPSNPLVMWAFTHLNDPRWTFTRKYMALRQAPENSLPQKLGAYNSNTWAAYVLYFELFLKRYQGTAGAAAYPDYGCTFEIFTNADFLELETLGPVTTIGPGESVTHIERWSLHRPVHIPALTDEELDRALGPIVSQALTG